MYPPPFFTLLHFYKPAFSTLYINCVEGVIYRRVHGVHIFLNLSGLLIKLSLIDWLIGYCFMFRSKHFAHIRRTSLTVKDSRIQPNDRRLQPFRRDRCFTCCDEVPRVTLPHPTSRRLFRQANITTDQQRSDQQNDWPTEQGPILTQIPISLCKEVIV